MLGATLPSLLTDTNHVCPGYQGEPRVSWVFLGRMDSRTLRGKDWPSYPLATSLEDLGRDVSFPLASLYQKILLTSVLMVTLKNINHWWTFSSSSTELEALFFRPTKLLLHMWKCTSRQGFCLLAFCFYLIFLLHLLGLTIFDENKYIVTQS